MSCFNPQSTYIYRAPQCMSPSSELGLFQPLSHKRVCPPRPSPLDQRVGGHTRMRLRGWGSPNSDDWRKSLSLCLLCFLIYALTQSVSNLLELASVRIYEYLITTSTVASWYLVLHAVRGEQMACSHTVHSIHTQTLMSR